MDMNTSLPHHAAQLINERFPTFKPRIGIVLGSGLGRFADELENPIYIPYTELPGFPQMTVQGHGGTLVLGQWSGVGVVCLQGRSHGYEGPSSHEHVKTYIRTLKCLGCEYFFAISASGSLREEVGPGELMLINDHISMQPNNPLVGPNDDAFGERFYPLDNAYDAQTRETRLKLATEESLKLSEGVYMGVLGPHYETAAEIRAFRTLGADAIGMSTIPEVLVANHCGLKVAVIAMITNHATGLTSVAHSHEAVVQMASQSSEHVYQLLRRFIGSLGE